jgi:YVTN family beta-propeller protein
MDDAPYYILNNPVNDKVYCSNTKSDDVVVLDAGTGTEVARIACGDYASLMAHNPVQNRVYVLNMDGWSVSVIRDSAPGGVEESHEPLATIRNLEPTIVRGVLLMPRDMTEIRSGISGRVPRPVLLDASGRKVIDLHPGANDVRSLAFGVYFVSEPSALSSHISTGAIRRVLIAK